MRARINFTKTEAMRFTSHLDLHRTWERTLRRAGLPLAYSQGYNPRPKLNLASALPLGFTSSGEVLDVWFEQELRVDEIQYQISSALPPGIRLNNIESISTQAPSLQSQLKASEYLVFLSEAISDLNTRLNQLLSSDALYRYRRNKRYDLRPLIEKLEYRRDELNGGQVLYMILSAREGATGRPDEVLVELGIDPLSTRIHRESLLFG